jgi:CheY-like chemotaxis protein
MSCVTETNWLRRAVATNDDAPAVLTRINEIDDAADLIRRMRCRVLLVDDDGDFRKDLSERLRKTYLADVEEAEDGEMALQKLTEIAGLDLVLMDVQMPELDGIETCARMREAGGFGHIVLMSSERRYRERVLECLVDFLDKSLDPDRFTAALEQILLHCCRRES